MNYDYRKNKRFTRIEINLSNLDHNLQLIQSRLKSPKVKIMAVVKSNAYGHGLIEISKQAVKSGVYALGVAFAAEGLALRKVGIEVPIFILGEPPMEIVKDAVNNNFILCLNSFEKAKTISQKCGNLGKKLKIHIKVNTGMNRLGINYRDAVEEIEKIISLPNLDVEGIFTHFSCAGEKDESYTLMQWNKFENVLGDLRQKNIIPPILHCANSAAFLRYKDFHLDMVRLGITIYGLSPFNGTGGKWLDPEILSILTKLKPVLSLKSKISFLKTLAAGQSISYGAAFKTSRDSLIATVPIGYADGYTRLFSNKAKVLIGGQLAPIVGNITMDHLMIDVTDIALKRSLTAGEEVTFIGGNGDDGVEGKITADWLAGLIGTINYEVLCMLKDQIPRVYVNT